MVKNLEKYNKMKNELVRRLLKFLSVKIFVFTVMVILALKGIGHWYFERLLLLSVAFFATRATQYIVNSATLRKKSFLENLGSQADELIEKAPESAKPGLIKIFLNLIKNL